VNRALDVSYVWHLKSHSKQRIPPNKLEVQCQIYRWIVWKQIRVVFTIASDANDYTRLLLANSSLPEKRNEIESERDEQT